MNDQKWCTVCEKLESELGAHRDGSPVLLLVWDEALVCTGCAPCYREGEDYFMCEECGAPCADRFKSGDAKTCFPCHGTHRHAADGACACQCGIVFDHACTVCVGADPVVIEWMPPQHRPAHEAAGNFGSYPHNGAVRLRVAHGHAAAIYAEENGWAREVQS